MNLLDIDMANAILLLTIWILATLSFAAVLYAFVFILEVRRINQQGSTHTKRAVK